MIKKEENKSGTGYEDGQYPLTAVLPHKATTKLLILSSRSI